MADPMKIRATVQGNIADIRVLMSHPMETGLRKDPQGNTVPAHFIQNISITLNGKTVMEGQLSQAISRNPVIAIKVRDAKAGDKVAINWTDTQGDKRTDEATVGA
jgi:sulfur-oxidizing protein SoxZ